MNLKPDLRTAVANGNTGKVESLIRKGANIHEKDGQYGLTYLILASCNGHHGTVKALLNHGADINEKEEAGYGALMYTSRDKRTKFVQKLLNKWNFETPSGWTALMAACDHEKEDTLNVLLKHNANGSPIPNANVNEKDIHDWTALMYASCHGYTKIVEALLKHGADVNHKSERDFWTALKLAEGHTDAKNVLLNNNVQSLGPSTKSC